MRVYPRGCGGAWRSIRRLRGRRGLSPRVRGSRFLRRLEAAIEGSIPAGAGEPELPRFLPVAVGVYPRGCGGATTTVTMPDGRKGLSPRVRGSLGASAAGFGRIGSIPAGAGEPVTAANTMNGMRVYPRGCGGAGFWSLEMQDDQGLSPRVRGSPDGAGCLRPGMGLSPRVRGSHAANAPADGIGGSIPAGAGEPPSIGPGL